MLNYYLMMVYEVKSMFYEIENGNMLCGFHVMFNELCKSYDVI